MKFIFIHRVTAKDDWQTLKANVRLWEFIFEIVSFFFSFWSPLPTIYANGNFPLGANSSLSRGEGPIQIVIFTRQGINSPILLPANAARACTASHGQLSLHMLVLQVRESLVLRFISTVLMDLHQLFCWHQSEWSQISELYGVLCFVKDL